VRRGRTIAKKVLILAGDTDGNLGDLAIVTATCDHLRALDPKVEIALLTSHAERDRKQLGIIPLKRGWRGLPDLIRWARSADLVICGGGGLFQDDDSLLKMPYWAVRLCILRLFARRIAGLSIGAGPLRNPLSRFFAGLALRTLSPISVRDHLASAVLRPLTRKPIALVPDPAFLLRASPDRDAWKVLDDAGVPRDRPLIGVALRRWFHTDSNLIPHTYAVRLGLDRNRGGHLMEKFCDSMAAVLNDVIAETNAHVLFMPTYNVSHEDDEAVCADVACRLEPDNYTILDLEDPRLYKAVTGRVSVMLCGRMHAAILAAGQRTAIVGLSYNQKFFGMFSLIGQDNRCMSITHFVRHRPVGVLSAMLRESMFRPDLAPDTTLLERATELYIDKLVRAPAETGAVYAEPQTQQY
jgi:polysaccharide pyruvyl transferase WcaK-like protein